MSFDVKDPLDADLVGLFNAGVGQSLEMNLLYATLAVELQNLRVNQQILALLKAAPAIAAAAVPAAPAVTIAPAA